MRALWAIGRGKFAQPKKANEMHKMIRKIILEKNITHAKHVKIIYGESMTSDNAEAMLLMKNIDDKLVGRCSIDHSFFSKIYEIAGRFKYGDMTE